MENKLTDWISKNIENDDKKSIPSSKHKTHHRGESKKSGKSQSGRPHRKTHGKGGHSHSQNRHAAPQRGKNSHVLRKGILRCIPLGGLDEVGKNMMVFEYENDIVIVDIGFQFPEEGMFGVDYVIPDISYLKDKLHKIRGIIITHGHLDHIGAVSYLLPKLGFPPIYGLPLSMGLVKKRLDEFKLTAQAKLHNIKSTDVLNLGKFTCDFFRVNHSIPDGMGIVLRTPAGTVVHTGDFKFDYTPMFQQPADYPKIAGLATQNVAALFSDSTNALQPGTTPSEKTVGETLERIVKNAGESRVIIASFASIIDRIQHVINIAHKYGRKVYLSGRSMRDNVEITRKLGYTKVPQGTVHQIRNLGKAVDSKTIILTTGAQGEEFSALTRMAVGDHPQVSIKKGDTVVISSTPIPGNERAITSTINKLIRLGANVIFNKIMHVHTSGHANQEDLKLMINLVKPKHLVPIHGELYMRTGHAAIGESMGIPREDNIIIENGDVLEIKSGKARKTNETVPANYVMIDGKGVGDVGAQMIMDRKLMADNGVLIVTFNVDPKTKRLTNNPEVDSRGFIHMKESQGVIKELISLAKKAYEEFITQKPRAKRGDVKLHIRSVLDRYSQKKLERTPLILPVFNGFD
jgi:ribonuclease J